MIKDKPCKCQDVDFTKLVEKLPGGGAIFECEHGNTCTFSEYAVKQREVANACRGLYGYF